MQLYTYFRSSASFRVRIALNLKGLGYEPVLVNLPRGEHQADDYRAVNVQALVPTLVDGDRRLIQSLAILEYLEECHPQPPLLPRDPLERAYVRALCGIVACEIHPLNNLRTLKHIRRTYGLDEAGVNAWYRHWIADGFAMIERYLVSEGRSGHYCLGDAATLADCCLVPQVFNAQRYECDLAPYPTAMRIFQACMRVPAFDAAQPSRQPDAA
ncbi:MAG: maleylacetoacetate isomerase [Burkholderiales bacterium]|nr:maleylacetoacetate isomerase [Burkholderiales bacterium]